MQASNRILAIGALAFAATLGSAAASAQAWNGGGSEAIGQSTSQALLNSTMSSDEVQATAVAAAHPTGTEATGQSTSMVMPASNISSDDVYKGAFAASHPTGTEALGQSTSLPRPSGS
ncbi:hypothetical protein BH10PSE18_BH10PSE18_40880 [soil metagenome]